MLRSIRTRLTVALFGLATVPLLVVGVVFAMMGYSGLRQQALVTQQLHAQQVATAVDSFVHELAGQLVLLAKVHDAFTTASSQEKKWVFDELLSYENRFQELSLLDENGMELLRRSRGAIVLDKNLQSQANDPSFQYPLATGHTYFGPVHADTDSGEPQMSIAVPLRSPLTGKTVGVFRGEARLKKIWELLASLPSQEGETVFIVGGNGTVVAHPDPSVVLRATRFHPPADRSAFTSGLENGRVAMATERIDLGRHPLYVVAQRSESEVMALARNTLALITVLMLFTLAIAAYFSILVVGHITRPLHDLAATARQIQEGDLTRRADYSRNDEVGELAMAFNAMTERVHQSLEEMAEEIAVRRQAETALREHRSTLRQILDTIPQSIFWKDREGVYLGGNQVFAQAAGLADPELVQGKTDFDMPWPRAEAEAYRADDLEVVSTNRSKPHIIEPLQQADGSRLWIDTTKVPLLDEQGEVYGVLGVYADITEKRKADEERQALEMQLRQAQKMEAIGTLAGGIAHDFNNILSIIFGFTELAMMEEDADKRQDNLGEVYKAAGRARDLVRQILTFSRKMEQQRQPLQVSLVVKEALKMLRASIPTTIEIRQNIASEAMAQAEPTQIHQVVVNLCTNAYQAMKESGGVLAVSLEEVEIEEGDYEYAGLTAGRYLKLDVGDTGSGIDPAIREKIFEPYFTTKGLGEGTGMGLAVVHGIVKSHHGHITLYSEPGKGTNFHVYLPVTEQPTTAATPATPLPPPTGAGERILFVDDEEQICSMANFILSKNGYQVTSFTDPTEALRAFTQQPDHFDLVMTDMTMPHLNGAELAQQLLAIKPELPIILCTGQSALIDREKALAMGIREYLGKPTPTHTLLATIHQVLTPR